MRSTKNKERKLKAIEHGTLQQRKKIKDDRHNMEHYKKVIPLLRGSTESRVQLFDCCALARNNSLYVFNLDQNLVRQELRDEILTPTELVSRLLQEKKRLEKRAVKTDTRV